ncbi:MAG: dTMP kinase [Cyanobacteria bacterium P01_H01_bin.15]
MTNGLFLVLEGIDGSGTSTQAELLKQYWQDHGGHAVISPEPSAGPIGVLLRQVLKDRVRMCEAPDQFNEQLAYLFAADRHDHLYNPIDGVNKLVQDGFLVISTRYYFSSLAYNCRNPEEFAFVQALNQRFPAPDLTCYVDIPVTVSMARLQSRSHREIYEHPEKLTQVRQNYQNIFQNFDGLWQQIDGCQTPEQVFTQILALIRQHYPHCLNW